MVTGKVDGRKRDRINSSVEYIDFICGLYGDTYDDREEDSKPQGKDWIPGVPANHLSLDAFRKKLSTLYSINCSTAKIRKILITGGRWSTERSREIFKEYEKLKRLLPDATFDREMTIVKGEKFKSVFLRAFLKFCPINWQYSLYKKFTKPINI